MHWDEYTDVIIVGSGAAGLSAAIEARQAGADVIVFEKMKITGGNTRISDGGLAAPGIGLQKRMGIADSSECFYDDIVKAGSGLNHPHLAQILAAQAAGAIAWTQDTLGVRYQDRLDRFGGHSVARGLTTRSHSGVDLIKAMSLRLKSMGIVIRTRCRMTKLISDSTGGIQGIQIHSESQANSGNRGMVVNVRARRAVVLATGGFAADVYFRQLHNPCLNASVTSTNHKGATAEGLLAAMEIGAAAVHLSRIQAGPWGCPDENGYGRGGRFASYAVYPKGVVVNPATGLRIVNEWGDRRQRCDALFRVGHPCVGIVDATGAGSDSESLKKCLNSGKVNAFSRIAELASAWDIPVHPLCETIDRYNKMVAAGERDEFGKELGNNASPLDTPPFYAMRLYPKAHYTPGGVVIDTQARVINFHNLPIPRLYAAGEVCGGVHGASRLGSCALTDCIVFGRIAGRMAAAEAPAAL